MLSLTLLLLFFSFIAFFFFLINCSILKNNCSWNERVKLPCLLLIQVSACSYHFVE